MGESPEVGPTDRGRLITPDWMRRSIERVTKQYAPAPCPKEAWPGTPCELHANHPGRCLAPSAFPAAQAALFDGMIPSHTNPSKRYRVVVNHDHTATCTCEGYQYRHRDCSHIKVVREVLNQEDGPT